MKIVGISGSLRRHSSNSTLLRAVERIAPPGVEIILYDGLGELPPFNPDLDQEGSVPPDAVARLRSLLIDADALLISSPEYAHGVPGVLKNMLDWLVSTGELVGKPVALLNASPAGGMYAQTSLRETLQTMNWKLVIEASRMEPFVARKIVGEIEEEAILRVLESVVSTLLRQAPSERRRPAG
ncbi:MAG TPA: NADPH-dependent FMN reductase [Thermoanaerobaculia bacterium]|nr:NADPH-dependent FMN reductase [Thermoanaerobaculia bacterium]